MSRAFVPEAAAEVCTFASPERPVGAAPNLVIIRSLGLIDARAARLKGRPTEAASDVPEQACLARAIRYRRARRASAQVASPATGAPDEGAFCTRMIIRRGGASTSYRIAGEDETDPPEGLPGRTSPLAGTLVGARAGDTVECSDGHLAVMSECIECGWQADQWKALTQRGWR